MSIKVLGCDISLNHAGFVLLEDGDLVDVRYFTNIVGSANRSKCGTRLPKFKTQDKQIKSMQRLVWIRDYIKNTILTLGANYIGIEDYALSESQGSHQLGEIGGIVRSMIFDYGVPMRLHDPFSIKMFVAHNGLAKKDQMESCVLDRWGVDFSDYNAPLSARSKKQNRQTSEDLTDAFSIAQLVWVEYLLRNGDMLMKNLHEKEVRVFNRITKAYPVNLLDRHWIVKQGD
jgi:Holliday junction resolvasome RuvABC endonuclease subunit